MKFFKNFNPLVALIVFLTAIAIYTVFIVLPSQNKDKIQLAAKRLENKNLPSSISNQINEEKFLIVYLSSACKACLDELSLLSKLYADSPELKLFGVMGEEESVIKNYIADNNIKFTVIRDAHLDMLRTLKIEFFPTNLLVKSGKISRVYTGVPENKETLLSFISD